MHFYTLLQNSCDIASPPIQCAHKYVTGFAKRGLISVIINIEKSRFEILITVYLENA